MALGDEASWRSLSATTPAGRRRHRGSRGATPRVAEPRVEPSLRGCPPRTLLIAAAGRTRRGAAARRPSTSRGLPGEQPLRTVRVRLRGRVEDFPAGTDVLGVRKRQRRRASARWPSSSSRASPTGSRSRPRRRGSAWTWRGRRDRPDRRCAGGSPAGGRVRGRTRGRSLRRRARSAASGVSSPT